MGADSGDCVQPNGGAFYCALNGLLEFEGDADEAAGGVAFGRRSAGDESARRKDLVVGNQDGVGAEFRGFGAEFGFDVFGFGGGIDGGGDLDFADFIEGSGLGWRSDDLDFGGIGCRIIRKANVFSGSGLNAGATYHQGR